ncbi:hemerythrin domain-containing protein [Dankookia sp. GCM10030260]|uniref:hemerythrin domain-containing protein n=1 Tax=Dankookia sp. GCM10030260 TaxID=3273390 RepID=UPI00361EE869
MSFRTLMQAGPAKANELFARLAETSDGAVKTREKLFTELKSELELHTSLEEQHLFPILKRNAETKGLVADAIKDNKELRAKLAELEVLPKNEETFPERLKELQKTFRQHARDDKRELLPAVQRALSEEQVQDVAEKMEASVAEAEQAKQDEAEERRAKVREEREKAEQQETAEQAQKAAAERAHQEELEQKRAKARQEREKAELQAEQEMNAKRAQAETRRRVYEATETVTRTAATAQASVLRVAESATVGAQRVGAELRGAANAYTDAARTMAPDAKMVASLPSMAISSMTEIRSAWLEWLGQATQAGTQMSQELLQQTAEQQRQLAVTAMQSWMDHSARVLQITLQMTQEGLRPFASRFAADPDDHRNVR